MKIRNERRPTHPGAILREDILPEIGLSPDGMAGVLNISTQTLNEIIMERQPVTADIAHRLGISLGMLPDIWLRMQQAVDLYDAKTKNARAY